MARLNLIDEQRNFIQVILRSSSEILIDNLYMQSRYINLIGEGLYNKSVVYKIQLEHFFEEDYYKYYL